MTTLAIKLYKALMAAGVDEDTARLVSEEVSGSRKDIQVLTARVNMLIGVNVAAFAGVVVLLLERLI